MNARRALACTVVLTLTAVFATAKENGPFDGLRFREIGPATPAGRIDDFAVLESNPAVFYVGTATGGIWKTTNNGTTFETVFDDQTTSSIGDLAVAREDPNLVWVGTGENNNRQSSSWGDGVYKSTDGGKTWKNNGARGIDAHRAHRHRSDRPGRRLRRGSREPLGRGRRTRCLQDD